MTGSAEAMSTPGALQQVDGVLAASAGQEAQVVLHRLGLPARENAACSGRWRRRSPSRTGRRSSCSRSAGCSAHSRAISASATISAPKYGLVEGRGRSGRRSSSAVRVDTLGRPARPCVSSNSANMVWRYRVPLNCSRKWLISQARRLLVRRSCPSRCSMSRASLQVEATSCHEDRRSPGRRRAGCGWRGRSGRRGPARRPG